MEARIEMCMLPANCARLSLRIDGKLAHEFFGLPFNKAEGSPSGIAMLEKDATPFDLAESVLTLRKRWQSWAARRGVELTIPEGLAFRTPHIRSARKR